MGSKILLVDDDAPARRTLATLLQQLGFQVIEAEDGTEALAVSKTIPIDLVLCDYNMPGMNGAAVLRQFRATQPQNASVPFIIISGYIERWPGEEGAPTPDLVLPKPLTMDKLLNAINGALKQRKAPPSAAKPAWPA